VASPDRILRPHSRAASLARSPLRGQPAGLRPGRRTQPQPPAWTVVSGAAKAEQGGDWLAADLQNPAKADKFEAELPQKIDAYIGTRDRRPLESFPSAQGAMLKRSPELTCSLIHIHRVEYGRDFDLTGEAAAFDETAVFPQIWGD
jgi:hypothetical protein